MTCLIARESDAMVAQAWTDWVLVAPIIQPYPAAGLAQINALLGLAGRLESQQPTSRHRSTDRGSQITTSAAATSTAARSPYRPLSARLLRGAAATWPTRRNPAGKFPTAFERLSAQSTSTKSFGATAATGSTTTIIQVPAQPGTPLPHSGRGAMPTYRQVPPPNGQPAPRTLHTHQPGSDRVSPSAPQPSGVAPRGIPPAIIYQVPQKPVTVPTPPSQSVPNKGSNQGGR